MYIHVTNAYLFKDTRFIYAYSCTILYLILWLIMEDLRRQEEEDTRLTSPSFQCMPASSTNLLRIHSDSKIIGRHIERLIW